MAPSPRTPIPGVTAALVTLYNLNLSVDYAATATHAQHLVEQGIGAVLVAGTTGEGRWLDASERSLLITAVRDALPSEVSVVAGISSGSGRAAALECRRAIDCGATGVICLSPRREAPERFYASIAELGQAEFVLAYHLPTESSPGLGVEQILRLPVNGVKDASGDANRMINHLTLSAMPLYVGAGLVGLARAAGCSGAVLALANIDPILCLEVWAGKIKRLPDLIRLHVDASKKFPIGLKNLMNDRFGTAVTSRWRPD